MKMPLAIPRAPPKALAAAAMANSPAMNSTLILSLRPLGERGILRRGVPRVY